MVLSPVSRFAELEGEQAAKGPSDSDLQEAQQQQASSSCASSEAEHAQQAQQAQQSKEAPGTPQVQSQQQAQTQQGEQPEADSLVKDQQAAQQNADCRRFQVEGERAPCAVMTEHSKQSCWSGSHPMEEGKEEEQQC